MKKDPLYCDENTPCTDPSRPFCDHDGEYPASEGIKHTCIPDPFPDGGIGEPDAAGPRAIVSLATSGQKSCAVFNDGGLRCWGTGYLGRGYMETDETPGLPYQRGDISTGDHVDEVAVGDQSICVRYDAGNVRCWGHDADGVLGNGPATGPVGDSESETPDMVSDLALPGPAKQLAVGSTHACVLLESGTVHCWGSNLYGELGYGHTNRISDASDASPVSLGAAATQIAVGSILTCALLETKKVRCWGTEIYGRLGYGPSGDIGDNEVPDDIDPVDVGADVLQIATGDAHVCALLVGGDVTCWGHRYAHGHPELATEDIGDDEVPASVGPVELGTAATQIVAGADMACALLESGGVRCWGDLAASERGTLGYGYESAVGDNETPLEAGTLKLGGDVEMLSTGGNSREHSCAKLENAEVRCWGANSGAQLGLGHIEDIGDDEEPDSEDQVRIIE